MIIGTLIYGTQLVKELELQQVARDTASMTARGTNFMYASNQAIVSRLGQELGWPNTGGLLTTSPGVVYVSTIEYLDSTCNTGSTTNVCSNNVELGFRSQRRIRQYGSAEQQLRRAGGMHARLLRPQSGPTAASNPTTL